MKQEQQMTYSPDWSTAPDWAQWWALDANGQAYWYERKPFRGFSSWLLGFGRGVLDKRISLPDGYDFWQKSLQNRPDNGQ